MTIRHASKLTRAQRRDLNKKSRQLRQTKQRRMRYEPLEARQLLAADVVPQLVGIQPNSGELLQENDVRGLSPRSLTFNFAEVNDAADLIDPATLDAGIVISRAGLDGKLGTADDVRITGPGANFEGFIGIGDQPNQVVVRFGEALPDDLYRIEITSDLTDTEGQAAMAFTRNFELNLAPQVMSVVPQPVTRNETTGALEIASDMIYVYFNDDDLDPTLATNPDYYQLTFQGAQSDTKTPTNSDLGLGNDSQSFYPESVVYDPINDVAMLKFSSALEELVEMNGGNDGFATVFRLQVGVRGIASKGAQILDTTTLDGGTDAGSSFETAFNLSDINTSVDLQSGDGLENYAPGTNLFAGNNEFRVTRGAVDINEDGEIDVNHTTFTIDDGLGNLRTFELVSSGVAAQGNITIDISGIGPSTTELAAAIRAAIVAQTGADFAVSASTVTGFSPDRSQLRGTLGNRVSMTLGTKGTGLIVDRTQALVIRGEIQNTTPYNIALPGGNDEPGHRDIELNGENHLDSQDNDGTGVSYYTYNFPDIYGYDPTTVTTSLDEGEPFHNQITEAQKQRAREIFEIYSFYSGIEFVEIPNDVPASIGVVTGDLRGISPGAITGPGGIAGLAGSSFFLGIPLAIMETADHDKPGDDEVGAVWQQTAFHEIGHLLGLTHTYDLPIGTIMGDAGDTLNFGQNIENLLPGDFDVTHLRHLHRPDVIDIDLYRFDITETGTLSAEVVAERLNDSSRLDATLTLYRRNGDGTYTAIARNNDYFSEDSFLEMSLEPGTYYVGISASGNNVYDPNVEDSGFGGTSEGEYELQLRFTPTTNDSIRDTGSSVSQVNTVVVQGDGSDFVDGATITLRDGTLTRVFEFDKDGTLNDPTHEAVSILPTSLQSEIVAALVAAINGSDFNVSANASGNKISLSNLAVNNPITLDPLIIQNQAVVVTKGAAAGAALDGDLDGVEGGNFNFWFRAEPTVATGLPATAPRTLFVDATYTGVPSNGSLSQPYKTIGAAVTAAKNAGRGDVIRVIGLPGINDDESTLGDNIAYLIGRDPLNNAPLRDGTDLVIPKGVTLMIDEGAILKFNNASIQVGSTSVTDDRSFAALQILGVPERYQPQLDENGEVIPGTEDLARLNRRVTLTSYRETTLLNDAAGDKVGNASFLQGDASPGNWGGILFNQEVDREQLRGNYADAGIFLNSVIGAEIRYAGGITVIDGSNVSLAPIYLEEARPTLNYNVIRYSAGAAVSADPNSFEESYYTVFKGATAAYTPDVRRIGPDIFGNRIVNNSTNGLLVRIPSTPGQPLEEMTVAGRFDDTDIVYVIQESLHINSTPGGATSDAMTAIKVPHLSGVAEDDYIIISAVTETGVTRELAIQFTNGTPNNLGLGVDQVLYIDLSSELALDFTESRLAELIADRIMLFRTAQAFQGFFLDIDPSVNNNIVALTGNYTASFNGGNGILVEQAYQARLDGSLVVDPNVVVKFNAGRIEVEMGANFIAEGAPGRPVVFTSLQDDRYGFGGTFDTNNNGDQTAPAEGDWSGIYFAHVSSGSIDRALIAYGGGESSVAGGQADFNAVEIHQAVVRVTNSTFEYNANGVDNDGDNAGGATRNNHMSNANAVIFMRDSQAVVVGNNFRFNSAYVLNVDTSSLSHELTVDWGRSTGNLDRQTGLGDNQGALVRRNLLTDNDLNAMVVRGGVLTTQSVWDDTDIVHVLFDTIYSTNFHTYGGIRIESSATESLVVKLFGADAGFEATGTQLDIDDRIGGMLHVVGQAGFPVIFTDLRDDTVGAGFDQNGKAQTDTNNAPGTPIPGSWKGLTIDQFANDRNVQVIVEAEANNLTGAGVNGMPVTAQPVGQLAADEYGGDDNRRLGFEVNGYLSNRADVDVYSFVAEPGTEVWFDIDKTSYYLDVVVELVDGDGNVLAGSTNSYDRSGDSFYGQSGMLSVTNPLQKSGFYEEDLWSHNPRDAGMRVVLPGQPGTARTYHVRVRSNGADLSSPGGNVVAGNTNGVYQLNIRLREVDELAGSSIQFADIRYAENGISIYGQPGHSPVLGESAEDQSNNDTIGAAHKLGNVLNSDRGAISVAGGISDMAGQDVDWYEFSFDFDGVQSIPGSSSASEYGSLVIDLDYAAGLDNANTIVSVYTEAGELVYTSSGGAVNDDLIHPQTPGNKGLTDLSRGSNNTGDPYLGTIMLPAGTPETPITYYVAVSSEDRTSVQMEQFFRSNATNTLTRLEPVNSVRRIVEDHIGSYSTIGTAPVVPSIIDPSTNTQNASQYVLGDFVLFLSTDATNTSSDLYTLDPFTGALEAYVGRSSQRYHDLAMAPDGTLYAYGIDRIGPLRDSEQGNFLEINTGDGSTTVLRDDGIATYIQNPNDNNNPVLGNLQTAGNFGSGIGWGYEFEATTFHNGFGFADGLRLYAVGNRGDVGNDATDEYANILFRMDASDSDGDNRAIGTPEDLLDNINAGLFGPSQSDTNVDFNEEARIDTEFDSITNGTNTLQTVGATNVVPMVRDGMVFLVDPDGQGGAQFSRAFEIEMGNDFKLDLDPANGAFIRDGMEFQVTGSETDTIRFQTGRVFDLSNFDINNLTAGAEFTVTDGVDSQTFVFDDGTVTLPGGSISIPYDVLVDDADSIRTKMIDAINASPLGATVTADGTVPDRITVEGDQGIFLSPGAGGMTVEGEYNQASDADTIIVNVEENWSSVQVVQAIRDAVAAANTAGFTDLTVSVNQSGGTVMSNRFNFLEAGEVVTYDPASSMNGFDALLDPTVFATEGVNPTTSVTVQIGAGFSAADIAAAIQAASVEAGILATHTAGTDQVVFETAGAGGIITLTTPFSVVAEDANGGFVTGLGWIGQDLFAVTNKGGLINLGASPENDGTVNSNFITTIYDDNGNPVQFQSLTAGPARPGGNTGYSDVLFGVSRTGEIYAFDRFGTPQFVFQGDRSHIATNIGSVNGLQFGTLNENLWHVTNKLDTSTAGHGVSVPVDNSRDKTQGGASLYFGTEDDTFVQENAYGNKTSDTYNFPGDAHGTVISDPFSLYGYNASDLPTLYFTYNLETDDQDYVYNNSGPDTPATDAMRVFIAGEDGEWHLLATNNSLRRADTGQNPDDEFDILGVSSDAAVDEELRADRQNGTEGVQELFDNTGWRQARIDLGAFAGQENLRLRFDFSTGGSVNLGGQQRDAGVHVNTEELRFKSGNKIADGGTFFISDALYGGTTAFEFSKGQSLTFDSGARIADGLNPGLSNQFTLQRSQDPNDFVTFEYVLDINDVTAGNFPIVFDLNDSAETIRTLTENAIFAAFIGSPDVQIFAESDNTFNIQGVLNLVPEPAQGITVTGNIGTQNGTAVIYYNSEMTATEMAAAAQDVINRTMAPNAYFQGHVTFNRYEEFIYGNGYSFDPNNSGLGHDALLQGDDYGYAGGAGKAGQPALGDINRNSSNAYQRGQNNTTRGVFIDDLIIGFAERGEMVTGATTNTNYVNNTYLRENQILTGEYQLEIRRGTDYGIPNGDGTKLILDPFWDFDTNDRLTESYTILAASGAKLGTGDRVRVGDGTDWVTFEFFDLDSITERLNRGSAGTSIRNAYDADNNVYSIGYYTTDSPSQIATKLMNAINDHAGQIAKSLISTTSGELGVYAQLNARNGVTTSNRVDLSPQTTSDVVRLEYDVQSDDAYREAFDLEIDGAQIAPNFEAARTIRGTIGDNDQVDKADGFADIDVYRFEMVAGQEVSLDMTEQFPGVIGAATTVRLFLGNSTTPLLEFSGNDVRQIEAQVDGIYHVVVSGNPIALPQTGNVAAPTLTYDATKVAKNDATRRVKTHEGNYELTIRVSDDLDVVPPNANPTTVNRRFGANSEQAPQFGTIGGPFVDGLEIRRYDELGLFGFKLDGDQNRHRDQGQIIISSNMISNSANYGILVDAGDRLTVEDQLSANNRPHQGAPINVPSAANAQRLATGVTIENNVIYNGGTGGILYSGDPVGGNNPEGAVPFGRIINNTLYGDGVGVGVRVEEAAGPTLMNNIIANFATGVQVVDATSKANTVLSRNLYQGNGANTNAGVGTGSLSIVLGANDPLFVDAANGNFYLAEGSKAIDAAVDAIQERAEVAQVVNPLGIASTPLLAPERDITGQLRVDDPNVVSGGGVGGVTFLDIGAFDRADFTGPTGYLFDPQDNDAADRDLNDLPDIVQWISGPLTNISIQLLDEGEISNQVQGVGVDDTTVTSGSVTLEIISSQDPILLVEGVDYTFDYDTTNNIIRLLPVSGVFQEGVLYKVTLDSDPNSPTVIRDLANNPIEFNNAVDDGTGNLVGETRYLVQVGALVDYGDAPDSYGTLLSSDGARHTLVDNFYLGSSVDAEVDGQPTFDASGDGPTDDGIYIRTPDAANPSSFLDFTLRDNISNELYITATAPAGSKSFGFVDAWIDFNQDGDFDDPGEQILFSKGLTIDAIDPQGSPSQLGQLITINNLPAGALEGDTIARFRYSSTGGLTPTGLADDGEVEDYQVTIGAPSVNPWHNGDNPLAVTKGDNLVTTLDLVTLLTELRSRTYTYGDTSMNHDKGDFLPAYNPDTIDPATVPAYLDVNNDRRVTFADLAMLIDRLTAGSSVSPEPISAEMITGSMDSSEPVTESVVSPIEVDSTQIVSSVTPTAAPVASTPTSIQSESIIGSESFVALAPSYSELQMRPAAELMGYRSSVIENSSLIVDEAIALDDLVDDDQFSQLIGDMADDLSASWDGKQFHDDSEDEASEEDELDELLTLISQTGSEE